MFLDVTVVKPGLLLSAKNAKEYTQKTQNKSNVLILSCYLLFFCGHSSATFASTIVKSHASIFQ